MNVFARAKYFSKTRLKSQRDWPTLLVKSTNNQMSVPMGNTIDSNTTYGRPGLTTGQSLARVSSGAQSAPPRAAESKTNPNHVSFSDSVALLQNVQSQINATPAVDIQKVEAARAAIAEGSYQIDHAKIASALISIERELP